MSEKIEDRISKDIAHITMMSGGFQKALILQVAVINDLFTYLSKKGKSALSKIAKDMKWDSRSTRIFLNALTGMGFLAKDGDRYENNQLSEEYLVESKENYMGDIIKHNYNMLQNTWIDLDAVLKSGKPSVDRRIDRRDEEETRNFILGMSNFARYSAKSVLSAIDLKGSKRLLDLGGGPGTFSIEFCKKYAELTATVFDLPEVIPILEEQVKKNGLEKRISHIKGNYLVDDIGRGYDIVLIFSIIHSLSKEDTILLFKKAYDSLVKGGRILVKEFVPNDDRTGPDMPLIFAVNMLVATDGGDTYTKPEMTEFLSEAGFTDFEYYDIPMFSLIVSARKA
jgi:hypothetical protein